MPQGHVKVVDTVGAGHCARPESGHTRGSTPTGSGHQPRFPDFDTALPCAFRYSGGRLGALTPSPIPSLRVPVGRHGLGVPTLSPYQRFGAYGTDLAETIIAPRGESLAIRHPFREMGQVPGVLRRFGGVDGLQAAIDEMQARLYAT